MSGLTSLALICGAVAALWLVSTVVFVWLVASAPELPDPDGESL